MNIVSKRTSEADLDRKIPILPPYVPSITVSILAEAEDYNHKLMNVPAMWKSTMGAGVRVAVLDTGLPRHVDLDPAGGKALTGDDYLIDEQGHATHVGGVLAAIANNDMGVRGIASDCEDYYGAVLGPDGSGSVASIIRGIRWAVDDIGADIISMSLGIDSRTARYAELEQACDYAASQGVAVIAAAGNEHSSVGQPACFDSVIAVGAVDRNLKHARFSNTGQEVQFVAGGVDVFSTYLNNTYTRMSGSSMSTPAISGIAALILSDALKGDNPRKLTPSELIEKMKKISYDIGSDGRDPFTGHGIPVFAGHPVVQKSRLQAVMDWLRRFVPFSIMA